MSPMPDWGACMGAQGFCFFNNVAVGALHACSLGCKKVLVLDWDVHHGNGIEEILYENPDIMYISLHRRATASPPASSYGPPNNRGMQTWLCHGHRRPLHRPAAPWM